MVQDQVLSWHNANKPRKRNGRNDTGALERWIQRLMKIFGLRERAITSQTFDETYNTLFLAVANTVSRRNKKIPTCQTSCQQTRTGNFWSLKCFWLCSSGRPVSQVKRAAPTVPKTRADRYSAAAQTDSNRIIHTPQEQSTNESIKEMGQVISI